MLFNVAIQAAGLWSLLVLPVFSAVHERLAALPSGWTQVGTPADSSTIVLQIGLQEQNLDQLKSLILAVSTPGDPSYGAHLDRDDVAALIQPSAASNAAVLTWLNEAGVTNVQSDGTWVTFATTVGKANELLNTQFSIFENDGVQKIRTTEYSVPDSLVQHIDLITPTTFLGKTTAHAPTLFQKKEAIVERQVDASCATLITPTCLKEIYNVNNYTADVNSGSKVGFGTFLNGSASFSDLALFEAAQGIPAQNFTVQLINGGVNNQSTAASHGEANLDVEYIVGLGNPLPVISYITGGSPPFIPNLDEELPSENSNEPYLQYYQFLLSQPNSALPSVITNSYGDDEQTVPPKYAERVCNMIGQMGLRGISVLESAGDTGVGAPCLTNDGTNKPQFTPQFPGTCPFITAVGGTQSISPEVAWVDGSGGFSNYFPRPIYQELAVLNYLNNHVSPATLAYYKPFTNVNNRGFPDVAAHSLNPDFSVVVNGRTGRSGGTSAAAPTFAGIVGLLNDARFRAGKPALGFLNPWIYAIGFQGLTDITAGGSVGCNGINGQTGAPIPGGGIIPFASWNATVGWDPVTGFGVPNFEKLKALALL